MWTSHYHLTSRILAPILDKPVSGLAHGLTLLALPSYMDILPLYVVLLALFSAIYAAIRRSPWLALGASAALWALAGLDHHLNLPNWLDDDGWYFNPFVWQFLFIIGAVLAHAMAAHGGALPNRRWLTWACVAYLVFCFLQGAPWQAWRLPNLQLFPMAMPDRSRLNILRVLDVLALMGSPRFRTLARSATLRPIEACRRHSLEIFGLGCLLALFGRLVFRTHGIAWTSEIWVNLLGLGLMCGAGLWLDHGRATAARTAARPTRHYWIPARHHSSGAGEA
jgi:hypothetical protein